MTLAGDINETGHLDDGIFPSFSTSVMYFSCSCRCCCLPQPTYMPALLPMLSNFGLVIMDVVHLSEGE